MDEKSLIRLEYDKICRMLADRAHSPMAKERALALQPLTDAWQIDRLQSETAEAFTRLIKQGEPPIGGLRNISGLLMQVQKGAVLSMGELLSVADTARSIHQARKFKECDIEMQPTPILDELLESLGTYVSMEKEITRCILSEEEMDDHASETLYNIRREMISANARVRSQLNEMIHSQSMKDSLQDPIVTVRQGRFCLPVKASARGNVKGLIHDQSSSGSTVFVEPMAIVVLNNHISELTVREHEEMNRILRHLSSLVASSAAELTADLETMIRIDFIFAKGKLALDLDANRPAFTEDGEIDLPNARHPLIERSKVVAIHIRLGGDFTTLVITGPNTGGKTVSLKTLGLLTLMGVSGLHIPASSGCRLRIPDAVYADIGDEQSIEQSLSTFSAHMVNISAILKQATSESLVLFDELGAGTDPVEGAALANAILEDLRKQGTLCAATTHYSELKIYALSTEGVENASCEFNVETLQPTYRLMIGVPGKSNAFAISRRLGLSEQIISQAQELMESNDIRFEEMMSQLEERRIQVEAEQKRISELRREIAALQSRAKKEEERISGHETQILQKARQEARDILTKAKADADAIISQMNKAVRDGANVDMRMLEENRARLRKGASAMSQDLRDTTQKRSGKIDPSQLRQGVKVHLSTLDTDCIILNPPDEKGNMLVRAGILQMRVKAADITAIVNEKEGSEKKTLQTVKKASLDRLAQARKEAEHDHGISGGSFGKAGNISTQVDLRGMNTEEALDTLAKYLDDAWLSGLERVSIVHGKGTGVLRSAVSQFLRKRPHIASYRLGSYGEGDNGVTIVEFQK